MKARIPNPVDKYVGNRVRMRRMMLGMSQGKLGAALNVTFQQVQKYEKGINRIGASRLGQISDVLQVDVAFFFDGAPGQRKADSSNVESATFMSELLATPDGFALVRAFTRLRDSQLRRKIVALVQEIAGSER